MDAYLMSGVRRIVYALVGKKADMPSYWDYLADLRKPDIARKQDNRTSDEIVNDLIERLRKEDA